MIVAFGLIERAAVVEHTSVAVQVERVIVEADIVHALGYLAGVDERHGIIGSHGTVALGGVLACYPLYASPVLLVLHAHLLAYDTYVRTLPLAPCNDGCKCQRHACQAGEVLTCALILGQTKHGGHGLAAETAYHHSPYAEHQEHHKGDAHDVSCLGFKEDIQPLMCDGCQAAECRHILHKAPSGGQTQAVTGEPAYHAQHQRQAQAAQPGVLVKLQKQSSHIPQRAEVLTEDELHETGVCSPEAELAAHMEQTAVIKGAPSPHCYHEKQQCGQDYLLTLARGGGWL